MPGTSKMSTHSGARSIVLACRIRKLGTIAYCRAGLGLDHPLRAGFEGTVRTGRSFLGLTTMPAANCTLGTWSIEL